jgi:uncharacterized protein
VRPAKKGFPWRKWNNILHRDLGYLAVGLTLIYAISGIAVNHTHHWNPSFSFGAQSESFAPFPVSDRETMVAHLVEVLKLPGPPKNAFRPAPHQVQLFYDGWNVEADAQTGLAVIESPGERWVLRDMNRLHLNHPKGAWTYVADVYAAILLFLAISGMFVLKGKKGLTGRGKWFVGAGVAFPIAIIAIIRLL